MAVLQIVILFVIAISANEAYSVHWLEVPLDHYNLFDNRTWQMRYFVNSEFFRHGNPIFIEVGGEAPIDGHMLKEGQVYKLASQHHGLLIETEHRYYGESLPFSTNFSTENMKYLQMELALEDLAFFIDKFKNSNSKYQNSKVVLHGCSYPGMLATWMRLKYPHLVDMAYASSAPLGVGLVYPEYFEIVNDVYANVSVSCIETIRQGFNATAQLMKTRSGRRIVREAFNDWECGDVNDMNSIEILYSMIRILNVQTDALQYEEVSCLILSVDTDDTDAFHRLANLVKLKSKDLESCKEDEEPDLSYIPWGYQCCTEMGSFQTLNRQNSRHPYQLDATLEESVDRCADDFDGLVNEHVLKTGTERVIRRYGGLKPKVTKVVTVQGTKDPWKGLASLEDFNPEAPVLMAEGTHCIDTDESPHQTANVLEVKAKAREWITKWLNEIS